MFKPSKSQNLLWCLPFITVWKESLWRCFYTYLSTGGGSASVHAGIADAPWEQTHPSWSRHPQEQTPPLGVDTPPRSRHPPSPPLRSACWETANKRAVRILLECNLVPLSFWPVLWSFSLSLGVNRSLDLLNPLQDMVMSRTLKQNYTYTSLILIGYKTCIIGIITTFRTFFVRGFLV